MRIRQIALVAERLDPVKAQLYALLGLDDAFVDPAVSHFGLQNIVTTIGDTFLEVVSPVEDGTTAGRLLERRGGDGGYMVIVQIEDFEAARRRVEHNDIRIVWQHEAGGARSMHLHPHDVPGALPSMDTMDPPGAWYYAGPNWDQRKARYATAISGAQVQVNDPGHAARCWANAYGADITLRNGLPVITMGNTELRFVPVEDRRGAGLQAVDIRTDSVKAMLERAAGLDLPVHGNSVRVCGTVFYFLPNG